MNLLSFYTHRESQRERERERKRDNTERIGLHYRGIALVAIKKKLDPYSLFTLNLATAIETSFFLFSFFLFSFFFSLLRSFLKRLVSRKGTLKTRIAVDGRFLEYVCNERQRALVRSIRGPNLGNNHFLPRDIRVYTGYWLLMVGHDRFQRWIDDA